MVTLDQHAPPTWNLQRLGRTGSNKSMYIHSDRVGEVLEGGVCREQKKTLIIRPEVTIHRKQEIKDTNRNVKATKILKYVRR